MDSTLGFIILRHVNNENTNKYWQHSYDCIRRFYPENDIVIIDDNSDPKYITEKTLYKTTILNSEYPKRGELLPYFYYSKNKWFDTACIIHDSVFIQKHIDMNVENYKIIWEFEHHWDETRDELNIIQLFNDKELVDFYNNKSVWKGCFGGMSIITHDFLTKINSKYDLRILLDVITTRPARSCFKRIIACFLQIMYKKETLLGNIHAYTRFGLRYDEMNSVTHLPIIKVWTGR